MKLKKGTFIFLLLTCLAYTTLAQLAQTDYTLQGSDVTINENGMITKCDHNFSANTEGTKLIITKPIDGGGEETIDIKGIGLNVFQAKNLVSPKFTDDSELITIGYSAFDNNPIATLALPNSLDNHKIYLWEQSQWRIFYYLLVTSKVDFLN